MHAKKMEMKRSIGKQTTRGEKEGMMIVNQLLSQWVDQILQNALNHEQKVYSLAIQELR